MNSSLQKNKMKLFKNFIVALVPLFMLWNHAFTQTIQIATAVDLSKIGNDPAYPLNGNYIQTSDINLSSYTNWTPINTFTGTYNGQYYTISNLTITGTNKSYQGLFKEISTAGLLKNIKLSNVNINLDGNSSNIGALVGYSLGRIEKVAVISGSVRAYYIVGGLAGRLLGSSSSISESYANVTVQSNGYIESFPNGMGGTFDTPSSFVGALLGENQNGGNVTNSYATGNVSGVEDVGGLIGYNTANGSTLLKCYASGAVSASTSNVGGLVGLNGGGGNDNYWNTTTTGQANGAWNNSNIGATGKTTTQMKQQATFTNWDFTNIWEIVEGVSQPTLRWMSLNTLPVSLLSFETEKQVEGVELTWKTVSENNNKEFIIYRSGDEKKFEKLVNLKGSGIISSTLKSYRFYDEKPLNGNNYYKLVQVDNNGKETELGIRNVYFSFDQIRLQVYPNPTTDMINILFKNIIYSDLTVSDLTGKILQRLKIKPNEVNLRVSLQNYSTGTYILHFYGNEGSVTEKVLKK